MAVFGLDAIKRRLGQGIVGSTVGGYQDPRGAQGIAARGDAPQGRYTSMPVGQIGSNNSKEQPDYSSGIKAYQNPTSAPNPNFNNSTGSPPGVHPGNKANWNPQPRFTNDPVGTPEPYNPKSPAISVFDPQIEAIKRRMQEALALGVSNRDTARQRVGEDYTRGQAELDKSREAAQRQLQANLASNGILRSGMNVEQMGQIGEGYQNSLDQLGTSRTRTLEDIESQWAEQQRQVAMQQEQLAFQQAQLNQQAALQQAEQEAQKEAAEESQRRQEEAAGNQFINVTPTGQLLPNEQRAKEMTGAWGADAGYYQDSNKLTDRINQIFTNMEVGTAKGETTEGRIARLLDEVAGGRTLDDIRLSASRFAPEGNKFAEAARRKIGQ